MSNTHHRSRLFAVLAILFIVIASSALILSTRDDYRKVAFFARSINDASYDCEDKIISKYGDRLISKSFDNLSSRYQQDQRQYLIFYRISITETDTKYPAIDDHLVKCVVWERLGYVSDFRIID